MDQKKTIVIGIGNPLLTDDSVGIKVSRLLADQFKSSDDISVIEIYAGGLRLMEAMVDYDHAILIDSVKTNQSSPGTVYTFEPGDLMESRNMSCMHDANLMQALCLAQEAQLKMPETIRIWGVEAKDVTTFCEDLTEDVAKAVPLVVGQISQALNLISKN
jgi:hydrogenase maturation protease